MLMRNRPEFHVADIGCLLVGATPISIYNSSSAEQIQFLAGHSRAEVAIVEAGEFLDRLLAVRDALPALRHVVVLDGAPEGTLAWEELLTAGAGRPRGRRARRRTRRSRHRHLHLGHDG